MPSPSPLILALLYAAPALGQTTYTIQTVVGSSLVGDGLSALNAQLSDAEGLALDNQGNVYIADPSNHRVRKVNAAGIMQTVAGTGSPDFSGDGGPASQASLNAPYGVAADRAGNLYIADLGNNRVRKVSPDGVITTVAGTGQAGSAGDGGPALAAQLNAPRNLAVDGFGGLYIAEFGGHRIRLDITSSNFPRWDRNPNTGHPLGNNAELVEANQTILHDQEHLSYVVLPVIPNP